MDQSVSSQNLAVSYQLEPDGFRAFVCGKEYVVRYPREMYAGLPEELRRVLAEHFVYSRTRSLLLAFDGIFHYDFPQPRIQQFIDYGIYGDIPRLAYLNNCSAAELRSLFKRNGDHEVFAKSVDDFQGVPQYEMDNRALLALSFGKDSLLTYGLARELGIDMRLVYVRELENYNKTEEEHKAQIISSFTANEHISLELLLDTMDEIFINTTGDRHIEDLENANGMLAFTLQLLPFAYHHRTRYIFFGNEANFSDYFVSGDDQVYPSFDQGIAYAQRQNEMLGAFTSHGVQVASLVEPIYNIVEMAILQNRYPDLLQYLMSCSPQEGDEDRWCYRCGMCAKAFLYLMAVGGDPKQIGFNRDFFAVQYANLYPIFNSAVTRVYELPPAVRDEQLLSFLLAYRRGCRGDLIERFREHFLSEALARETELREKFLTIHSAPTIPTAFKQSVLAIYQEEIQKIS